MKTPSFRTLIVAAFAAFTLVLSAPAVHAAEPGAPAPTQQPADAPAPKADAPKPAARREDIEPETLPSALAELKKSRADRDAAEAELLNANAATERTKQLLATTLETCKVAQKDRDTAQTELATTKTSLTTETAAHGKTKELLVLAEAAAGVLGVAPGDAVAAGNQPKAKQSIAEWDKKIAAAKTPLEIAAVTKAFEEAVKGGEVA